MTKRNFFLKMAYGSLFVLTISLIANTVFIAFNSKRQIHEPVAQNSEKLSIEEYQELSTDLLQMVADENPRFAINYLKSGLEKSNAIKNSCHELLHEIGFESYRKYKDFAKTLEYKDDICVSGFIHGVIEARFSGVGDIEKEVESTCSDYPEGKFITWECYHGVGHGLMYYNNNEVPKALEGCRILRNDFARSACSNGVYMENFNADNELHPSAYLNPENPFYPCTEFSQDKEDCYMNAPIYFLSLNNYDYQKAFKWCEASKESKEWCFWGVSSQMARRNMNNPKLVENFCMNYAPEEENPCIQGLVSWYVSYWASLEEGINVCQELENFNRPKCQSVIDSFRSQF